MAIPIAQSLADGKDLTSPDTQSEIVTKWADWATSATDVGNQIRSVLGHTRNVLAHDPTRSPAEVAREQAYALHQKHGRSGGNGSLMRPAPIPLAFLAPDDADGLTEATRAISDLTHFEADASDACVLWAHAIAHAIRTGELDVRIGIEQIAADRRERWLALFSEAETHKPRDFDHNGWVVQALQGAWSAIHHTRTTDGLEDAPGHIERALLAAVRGGRDADTVAAITGALVGAAYGISAIPLRWRRILHGWPHTPHAPMGEEQLVILAERILDPTFVAPATYEGYEGRPVVVPHPHDDGVWLGNLEGLDATPKSVTAVVSLSRVGTAQVPAHIAAELKVRVRLIDDPNPDKNPNLNLTLADAAHTVAELRAAGHTVYVHCVQAWSRTPAVAALYSALYCDINLDRAWEEVRAALPHPQPKIFLQQAVRDICQAENDKAV